MANRLFYRWGERINQRPAFINILQDWEAYAPGIEQLGRRIRNAYDVFLATYLGGQPAAILEPIALDISSADEMPPTFDELTGNGTWETHRPKGKTLTFVDLTTARELRNRGIASHVRYYALRKFWDTYEHIMTFSPLDAMAFHVTGGAECMRTITNARLLHSRQKDVAIMQYK